VASRAAPVPNTGSPWGTADGVGAPLSARAFWHSNRPPASARGQCSPYLDAAIVHIRWRQAACDRVGHPPSGRRPM